LNGKVVKISELQIRQVRGNQRILGLSVDSGEDFEFGVGETRAVYQIQIGPEEAMFVEKVTGCEMGLIISLEN
jgi:hypothetical protein